jgi:hypothetical protein
VRKKWPVSFFYLFLIYGYFNFILIYFKEQITLKQRVREAEDELATMFDEFERYKQRMQEEIYDKKS